MFFNYPQDTSMGKLHVVELHMMTVRSLKQMYISFGTNVVRKKNL